MNDEYIPPYAEPLAGFQSRKAAQLVAYFALASEGVIEKLKLIKLVYLSERAFLKEHQFPMLFDEMYSLKNGPICSSTLNGIDGVIHGSVWSDFIAKNGNKVIAKRRFERDDLDELSDAELAVADAIWIQFKDKTSSQMRNYTHQHCPEYTEVESGRLPISYRDVLEALGDPDAEAIDREIRDVRRAEALLAV